MKNDAAHETAPETAPKRAHETAEKSGITWNNVDYNQPTTAESSAAAAARKNG